MGRRLIERRLRQVAHRLRESRADLAIVTEQLEHLADDEDDAAVRALVSESPFAEVEHRQASSHAAAMRRHRDHLVTTIAELEGRQDQLLDELAAHL